MGVYNQIEEIYSILDVFVLPSQTEGQPMVLLEAMASKTPIIATTVGGIPNIISNILMIFTVFYRKKD